MNGEALLIGLLLAGAAVDGSAAEPSRAHLSGAAGYLHCCQGARGPHLGAGTGYALNRHISLGADLSYSYLASGRYDKQMYLGLATLTAGALPSAKVSPYVVLGYGLARYVSPSKEAHFGPAAAVGAGLQVRLSPRASLFLEGRLKFSDESYRELPVRIGVHFGL